jgi:hypothetical protein
LQTNSEFVSFGNHDRPIQPKQQAQTKRPGPILPQLNANLKLEPRSTRALIAKFLPTLQDVVEPKIPTRQRLAKPVDYHEPASMRMTENTQRTGEQEMICISADFQSERKDQS